MLLSADDEDDSKKKRELIPLSYSDDEDDKNDKARLSKADQERKAREIVDKVPKDKDGLWSHKIKWSVVDEVRS